MIQDPSFINDKHTFICFMCTREKNESNTRVPFLVCYVFIRLRT